jgi:hypothetical protein
VVDAPQAIRRGAVPFGPGARRTIVVLLAMIVLLATGAVPPAVAGLLAAGALVVGGVLTIDDAYRGISWSTVILVGGMLSLSTAMVQSGAADTLADGLVDGRRRRCRPVRPPAGAVPAHGRARAADQQHGHRPDRHPRCRHRGGGHGRVREAGADDSRGLRRRSLPDAGGDACQPDGAGPGGYWFGDYWKLGLPLLALFGVVAVLLVPVFWSF